MTNSDLPKRKPSINGHRLDDEQPSLIDHAKAAIHAAPHPRETIQGALNNLIAFGALYAFADLRVADHLADGGRTVDELAGACDADPGALRRMLAVLVPLKIVHEDPLSPDRYLLTRAGATLISTRSDSMRPAVLIRGQQPWMQAVHQMPQTVRTGASPLVGQHGGLYGYLDRDPRTAELFDEFMTARAVPVGVALADQTSLFAEASTVVDLGGGRGVVLSLLLQEFPHLRGVLLEREPVIPHARRLMADYEVAERCTVIDGDLFGPLPQGDVYLLSSITHNWPDEQVVGLLQRIAETMAAASRPSLLLIVDMVLRATGSWHPALYMDALMMALTDGGRERTAEEFRALADRAGLIIADSCPLPHGLTLMVAVNQPQTAL